jgi:hypothetical protein
LFSQPVNMLKKILELGFCPSTQRLRQKVYTFEASLDYTVRHCLKEQTNK